MRKSGMKIAIASGKGGTGKTTVATNLAFVAAAGRGAAYVDCDVEEPNGAIFLRPAFDRDEVVTAPVPRVDSAKCTGCDKCGQICQFSAIVSMNGSVLKFPELCHGCGGCWLACPAGAISQGSLSIGRLQSGPAGRVHFVHGVLDVGQARSTPLISAVKAAAPADDLVIFDCPPGTSCPVIESVRGADYVLLVTEPTPFGLNDLRLAIDMVGAMKLPFGVLINRADAGDDKTRRFCAKHCIPVLAELPDVRAVAEAYSRGTLAAEASPLYRKLFEQLIEALDREVRR